VALLASTLLFGLPLGLKIRRQLHMLDQAAEISRSLHALRRIALEVHAGCELPAGREVPVGLLSRLNRRDDLTRREERLRKLLRDDPEAGEELARAAGALDQLLEAGSHCLLLRIETGLGESRDHLPGDQKIASREEHYRQKVNAHLAALLSDLDLLEVRNQTLLQGATTAMRGADLLVLAAGILFSVLLYYLWRTRRQREKHLQGARLVEDMLEAYSRRLEAMNAELEQVNLLKTQILANTSHELLTPLNGVMGSLEVVRSGACVSPQEEREFIDQAYSSADQLLSLIRNLLDLCRLEEGDFALQTRELEFGPLLDRVLARHRGAVSARGLALLVIAPADGWPRIRADSTRLDQVLQHLLSNAIKFTESGSIRVTGRTEDGNGRFLRVELADTGVGIEAEKLPRVFDLFQQADGSNTRRFGGTGLGLTLSRHLIRGMGGEIGIESGGPGTGTRVHFTLPVATSTSTGPVDPNPRDDSSPRAVGSDGPSSASDAPPARTPHPSPHLDGRQAA